MPTFDTPRLRVHAHTRPATSGGEAVRLLLLHGNVSSGAFFGPLINALPPQYDVLAPDLRGYGDTEPLPIDATHGLRDFSDDVGALLSAVGWTRDVHVLGWSMGGGVAMQVALDHPESVASLTLVAPISPFGFGGTHGEDGRANVEDFAGSGGGTVNADFVRAVANGDRSDAPGSPRDVMRSFYFHTYRPPADLEEALLDAMLKTRTGEDHYPGDFTPSPNWPHVAPGTRGVANAFSPKYQDLSAFADLSPGPPVLWVRGAHDRIVSDLSTFDLAVLGQLGIVPGWPGVEACPPQPMNAQMRRILERYAEGGGTFRELIFEHSGHSPFLEEPEAFLDALVTHTAGAVPHSS